MQPKSQMLIKTKIISEIEAGGPASHHDIADALGMSPKLASAHLCNLGRRGVLTRIGKRRTSLTGRPYNIWGFP